MIRLFTGDTLPSLEMNWQSTYIMSRFLAYGSKASFSPFYVDDNGAVLSVLNGHGVLYGKNFDIQEWACFLAMSPDILSVTTSKEIAQSLSKVLQKEVIEKKVMRLTTALSQATQAVIELTPRQVGS